LNFDQIVILKDTSFSEEYNKDTIQETILQY
jgi:hypothetical protein